MLFHIKDYAADSLWDGNRSSFKLPTFCTTSSFIIMVGGTCYLFLFWVRWIHLMTSHPVAVKSVLMLSSHLHLGFPRCLLCVSPLSHWMHFSSTCPAHFILFDVMWIVSVKEYEALHCATFSSLLLHTPTLSGSKLLPKHLRLSHNATQKFHAVQSMSKMTVLYVRFNLYVSRQQMGRRIFLNWMITGIPRI